MNGFRVVVFLEVFVAVSCGFVTPPASAKSCEFPHKGDGGALDQEQRYIDDSVFVWVDVAKNCFPFVTDQRGMDALNSWIDASHKFDIAMKNGDEYESLKMLNKSSDSFQIVAPFISKSKLSKYFMKVYDESRALVKNKNLQDTNAYMVAAYPQFKEKLGCQSDGIQSV